MSGIATAIVGSAVIGGGMSMMASNNAASKAAGAQNNATDAQERIANQTREDFTPYRDIGTQGAKDYAAYKANPTAYLNTPAYQWQQSQIDKGMNRQLSARGRSNSSYGMNSLANAYGNLGVAEYQNAYNRILDPIKIGQGAASSTGQSAQTLSSAYGNAGTNLSNIAMNNGNNQSSLYSSLPNLAATAYKGYNAYNSPDPEIVDPFGTNYGRG